MWQDVYLFWGFFTSFFPLKLKMRVRKLAAGGERENRDTSVLRLTFEKRDTAMMTLGTVLEDPLVCSSLTTFKEGSDDTEVREKGIDPLPHNNSLVSTAP